jgi:hypothetical protein
MASSIKHGNTCGTYLTRLAEKMPYRVIKRRGDTRAVYHIKPPAGWNPKLCKDPTTGEEKVAKMVPWFKIAPTSLAIPATTAPASPAAILAADLLARRLFALASIAWFLRKLPGALSVQLSGLRASRHNNGCSSVRVL